MTSGAANRFSLARKPGHSSFVRRIASAQKAHGGDRGCRRPGVASQMPWIDKEDTACRGKWSRTLPLTASSLAAAGVARAGQDRLDDPGAQKTLRTMNDASIRYRPDLFGQITRMS